jgi:serine/threonine protein kinase
LAGDFEVALPDRYTVHQQIGRGGMAIVVLARDLQLDRDVAVKVLRPELRFAGPSERFLQEIRITAQLTHPNILPLHDSGDAAGVLYYVMPFATGGSLRDRLNREGPLSVSATVDIAAQVAEALDYSHGLGIIHRDIKPENILFSTDRHALVADFGIARVLSVADADRLSQYGMAVGTVQYMSPEQCAADRKVDGRTDVYALGCVVYEMLAGEPPFTGPSHQAISAKHQHERPPSLRVVRPTVSEAFEDALEKALAKVPADRFATAGEFAAALRSAAQENPAPPSPSRPTPSWMIGGGALAALALALALGRGAVWGAREEAPPDSSRYAIFPFEHEPETPRAVNEVQLLHDAMARWTGISVVDPFQVRDALGEDTLGPATQQEASRLSRRLGAGRYIRGSVSRLGDSLRVEVSLYNVGDGHALAGDAVRFSPNLSGADSVFALMADRLLFRGVLPRGAPALVGTHSLPARQAFAQGQQALDTWDLQVADSAFANAGNLDPGYTQAQLWLALVRAWSDAEPARWRVAAEQAALGRSHLSRRDRGMADAVVREARGDWGAACTMWRQLTAAYPTDFAAWYGTAHCLRQDNAVVADPATSSGWRFRSSFQEAIRAYRRAFELRPSVLSSFRVNAYEPVRRLLMTSRQNLRQGHALAPDTGTFSARATWTGDSLMLVPYPIALTRGLNDPWDTKAVDDAIVRQRELFRDITITWATMFPASSAAEEALAVSLEMLGSPAAADTFRRARALAKSADDTVRIGAGEVWVQVKSGVPGSPMLVRQAKALADSLLNEAANAVGASRALASLAALTGRATVAAAMARRAALQDPSGWIPPFMAGAGPALWVFASFGGPLDSLRLLERQLASRLEDPSLPDRDELRMEWLGRAARLAAPSWPQRSFQGLRGKGDYLIDAQAALAEGDADSARRVLLQLQGLRRTPRAADRAIDAVYPEAVLFTRLGLDQGAIAWLEPTLQNLRQVPPGAFNDPPKPGALVNAMALRADLAAKAGDTRGARRWAELVSILWSDADEFLQPVVQRMKALANR